jgi:hypothetical protein
MWDRREEIAPFVHVDWVSSELTPNRKKQISIFVNEPFNVPYEYLMMP